MSILIFRRRHHTVPPFLVFSTQPGGANSGSPFSPQPVVTAKNPDGSTNTSFTGNVTLAVNTVTGSHALGGTVTVAAVAGVATFSGVTDTGSGDGTLTATAAGYTSATSASFTTAAGGTVNRTDNFNRADSTTGLGTPSDGGSAWTARVGVLGITSNQVVRVSAAAIDPGTGFYTGAFSTLTCDVNGTVAIDRTIAGSSGNGGLIVRWSAGGFFMIRLNDSTVVVEKVVSGSLSSVYNVASVQGTISTTATLKVILSATGFEVRTVVGASDQHETTVTDAFNNTAVEHGPILRDLTGLTFDNFSFVGA